MSGPEIKNPEDEHTAFIERLSGVKDIANKRIEILKSIQHEFRPMTLGLSDDDDYERGDDGGADTENKRNVADAIANLAQDTEQLWRVVNDLAQSYFEGHARGAIAK
ncbi:MAG TPA: hypothetical protein VJ695_07415 [Nitrososphaera sp.]|nr:hypothetical protein [Nitrososphaera sp.]